jgi:DNA-binding CsgD family transcriptional regulator/PAS domain-containing protein
MDQDALLQLIGEIYDAGADSGRWPQVLEQISDAFGAQEAALGMVSPVAVPWLIAPRSDPEFLHSYGEYYHARNLFWRNMSRLPVGVAAYDTMVMPKSELQASEFYNDWSRPQGYLSVMGATLFLEDGWRTEFVVPGKRDFEAEHLRLYNLLAPHLVRAVQLNQRLGRAEIAHIRTAAALDRLEQGVLLTDGKARVIFANRAAEALFATGGLRLRDRAVQAQAVADTTALHNVIAACADASLPDGGGYVSATRAEGRPLSLLVIALRTVIDWLPQAKPVAVIFITDPDRGALPDGAQLQRQFGLTPAESRFALEILKGDGIAATAERLGILPGTARTHLHRVLAKTGTKRQADLVRLLLTARHGVSRQ